jgi:hypothetical protein
VRLIAERHARLAVQDLHQAEATGEQFHVVILSDLFENFDDSIPALSAAKKLLLEDAVLFIDLPMLYHLQLRYGRFSAEKMLVDERLPRVRDSEPHDAGDCAGQGVEAQGCGNLRDRWQLA